MDLLSISAFAHLTRLSPKALRLYDELGLLAPAHVDPASGYRWYSPGQLARARRVAQLRQLDMPLARIRTVIDLPPEGVAAEVGAYWAEQRQAWQAKQELVDYLISHLTGKATTMYDVSVRALPARTLLTITEHLTPDQIGAFATPLFALFGGPTVDRPEGEAGRPFLRYHGEISNDSDGPVEFCCPINAAAEADLTRRYPDMTTVAEQAGREAYISVPKANMMTAVGFESLHQWLIDHDEEADWLPRQIFLRDPETAESTDAVYELAVGLRG